MTTVFISWSSERSEVMGNAVKKCLEDLFPMAAFWMSNAILPGIEWRPELDQSLREARVVILCITRENTESRWIHWEAGYAAATRDPKRTIIPFCLDDAPRELQNPLASFKGLAASWEGIRSLVKRVQGALKMKPAVKGPNADSHDPEEALWRRLAEIRKDMAMEVEQGSIPNLREFEKCIKQTHNNLPVVDGIVRRIADHFRHEGNRCFPVFICGSAAIGKPTFARVLKERILVSANIPCKVGIFPTDSCSLPRAEKKRRNLQGYEPESHDLQELDTKFRSLVEGGSADFRDYDHGTGAMGPQRTLDSLGILIVEGVYAFYLAERYGIGGLRVFLYAEKPKAKELKFAADIAERSKTVEVAFDEMDANYESYEKNILQVYFDSKDPLVICVRVRGYWYYSFD